MEFRVLGPLEVWDQGELVVLGAPKVRVVCGILLVRPGALVAVEQFVDEMWPDRPPPDARALVRGYVSRLRRALRRGPSEADRVATRKPGYLLRVDDQELDLHRFERLVTDARAARQAGQPGRGVELFRRAHGLWRGDPFADVPHTTSIGVMATWLTERRLATMEERFDAALSAGQDADVIAELTEFVAAHPLRERPAGQLMVALYQCGRQAEALARYQQIRRALADEVGVEPCIELQQLHLRILNADPTLGAGTEPLDPAGAATLTVAARPPRQLPRPLSTFVGRSRELVELRALLEADEAGPVVVIHGSPGVGKSALAVHAAHISAPRFPDGQLHVNLCGATTGVEPLSAAGALYQLLRALGVAATAVPPGVEEAAGLFRTAMAQRRGLLVLDNAATAAQVRPLLPGSGISAVLITSRTRLATLEGATHVHLGPLSPDAAHTMLDRLIADGRTTADPDATRRLARLCDHLPLGLQVAAARLNARPHWAVRGLVDRLTDQRHRLTELAVDDLAVRSSLMVSYTALRDSASPVDRSAARAFRMFGVLPLTGIDVDLAAQLLDTSPLDTDRAIERLLDAHLVEETAPGRYAMHDLIRLFAHELATDTIGPDERTAAVTRVLRHYLATARRAISLAYPHRTPFPVLDVHTPPTPLTDHAHALRWLEDQRRTMVAVIRQALRGPTEHARLGIALTLALHWYHVLDAGDLDDTINLLEEVTSAAIDLGDQRSQAYAHDSLAACLSSACQPDKAASHLAAELSICRETGDRFDEHRALSNIAGNQLLRHRPDAAIPYLRQQLALAREIDAPIGRACALVRLGKAHHQLGYLHDAVTLIEAGMAWYERNGDSTRHCDSLEVLARVHIDLGLLHTAIALTTHSLDRARQTGYRLGEIWALTVLAQAWRRSGHPNKARRCAEQAVATSHNLQGTQARLDALAEYEALTPH